MKKINFTTIIAVTYILYIIIFATLIFGIFYIKNNLNENKESFEKFKYDKLIVTNPIKINENELTEAKITISKENIDILNAHLNYINSRNEEAIELSHKTIDNDIDRLNTFMAVGIGLLSLFGIVLPIATTFFQTESLKSKIDDLEKKDFSLSEKKINDLYDKIKNIESDIPSIRILKLQYYIGRLLSYDNNEDKNKDEDLKNILSGITEGLNLCKLDKISVDKFFNITLGDFKRGIGYHEVSISGLTDRRIGQESITKLKFELDNLINKKGSIDNLIEAINLFRIN